LGHYYRSGPPVLAASAHVHLAGIQVVYSKRHVNLEWEFLRRTIAQGRRPIPGSHPGRHARSRPDVYLRPMFALEFVFGEPLRIARRRSQIVKLAET